MKITIQKLKKPTTKAKCIKCGERFFRHRFESNRICYCCEAKNQRDLNSKLEPNSKLFRLILLKKL